MGCVDAYINGLRIGTLRANWVMCVCVGGLWRAITPLQAHFFDSMCVHRGLITLPNKYIRQTRYKTFRPDLDIWTGHTSMINLKMAMV